MHSRWKCDAIKLIYKSHKQKLVSFFFSLGVIKVYFLCIFIVETLGHGWGRASFGEKVCVLVAASAIYTFPFVLQGKDRPGLH